jgi:DNA-binding MarR family transcriptional regulator
MANEAKHDLDMLEDALTLLHRAMSRHRMWEYITTIAGVSIDRTGAVILHLLAAERGKSWRLSELADKLGVEAPTVTRNVQQLEEAGLVKRHEDEQDRRAQVLRITSKGRDVLRRMHKAKRQNLAEILENWPAHERRMLAVLLHRMAEEISSKSYQSISSK